MESLNHVLLNPLFPDIDLRLGYLDGYFML